MPMNPVDLPPLAVRKLKSAGNNRVLAGLKAARDAAGLHSNFISYGEKSTVVMGHGIGHPDEVNFATAYPPGQPLKEQPRD